MVRPGSCSRSSSWDSELGQSHQIRRIGIGFGGPVDTSQGRVIKSHQIDGWDNFHLVDWCRETFGLPAVLGNDCDAATLAEARFGAGQGRRSVFYVTVGTGVGGGFVKDGRLLGAGRPAACEIGHLRPGLHADQADETVESLASGWGIAAAAQARIGGEIAHRDRLPCTAAIRRWMPWSCVASWPTRVKPNGNSWPICSSAATAMSIR